MVEQDRAVRPKAAETVDVVVLAGGRCSPEMAARTGCTERALIPWQGEPFLAHVLRAAHAFGRCGRVAVVGPPGVAAHLHPGDLHVPERDTIVENTFAALDALASRGRVLVTVSDNPLLTAATFDDLVARSDPAAAVSVPALTQAQFLARFPGATNVCIRLRDGAHIGGCAVLLDAQALPRLRPAIARMLEARKSLLRSVGLLGPLFAVRFALGRATVAEVERRASRMAGAPVRFVRDCDPVFPIDIDDVAELDYLTEWARGPV